MNTVFTLRVYGILINAGGQVLLSDEYIRGNYFTKFPGGGMELGEGTRECLQREFMEELNLKVEVGEHIYTTDIYQQSVFNPIHQIVAIYYRVHALEPITVPLRNKPFDFDAAQLEIYKATQQIETARLVEWDDFSGDALTLPLDKIAAEMVKKDRQPKKPGNLFEDEFVLENDLVKLISLNQSHFAELLPVAMENMLWEFTSADIYSEADFKNYFDAALQERQQNKSYPFAIFDKSTGRYAGSTRFGNIDQKNKRAEIGWTWIHPSLHSTGFNRQCKFLLLSFAFEKWLLNRVELKTSSLNLRSQKAMKNIGAVQEGIFRRHSINDDGSVRDSVFFSFIKDEWEEVKGEYFGGL